MSGRKHKIRHWNEGALNIVTFARFYRHLVRLRFPMPVSEVLELRAVINDAAEHFSEPEAGPAYREFCDLLQNEIETLGITHHRARERLMTLLSGLRELHYEYSINCRDRELGLRERITSIRHHQRRTARIGAGALLIAACCGLMWLLDVLIPVNATGTFAALLFAWGAFRAQPRLEREYRASRLALNTLLRERVDKLNWKRLTHKLALLMGYIHGKGTEAFRLDESEHAGPADTLH